MNSVIFYRIGKSGDYVMNQENLKTAAEQLNFQLKRYEHVDLQVGKLAGALEDLLAGAIEGTITEPVKPNSVPGDYFFLHSSLSEYTPLETAYEKFKLELTGGPK